MKNNKNIFIIISIIAVMIIVGILFVYMSKQSKINDYLYFIDYFDDYIPGYNYDSIYIKEIKLLLNRKQAAVASSVLKEHTFQK